MTPNEGNRPTNLSDQVASADSAVRKDAERQASTPMKSVPVDRRPIAVLALVALLVTIWLSKDRWNRPVLDASEQRAAMLDGLTYVGSVVQQYRDSTGTLPSSLATLGFTDLPVSMTATANAFRLAAVTDAGDSVFYLSPAQPAPETR